MMSNIDQIRKKIKENQPLELDEAIALGRYGDSQAIPFLWNFYIDNITKDEIKSRLLETFKYVFDEDVLSFFQIKFIRLPKTTNAQKVEIIRILSNLPKCKRLIDMLYWMAKSSNDFNDFEIQLAVKEALKKIGVITQSKKDDDCDISETLIYDDPGVVIWHGDINGWCHDK